MAIETGDYLGLTIGVNGEPLAYKCLPPEQANFGNIIYGVDGLPCACHGVAPEQDDNARTAFGVDGKPIAMKSEAPIVYGCTDCDGEYMRAHTWNVSVVYEYEETWPFEVRNKGYSQRKLKVFGNSTFSEGQYGPCFLDDAFFDEELYEDDVLVQSASSAELFVRCDDESLVYCDGDGLTVIPPELAYWELDLQSSLAPAYMPTARPYLSQTPCTDRFECYPGLWYSHKILAPGISYDECDNNCDDPAPPLSIGCTKYGNGGIHEQPDFTTTYSRATDDWTLSASHSGFEGWWADNTQLYKNFEPYNLEGTMILNASASIPLLIAPVSGNYTADWTISIAITKTPI